MGVSTALEALKRSEDTRQLTLTTTTLAANETHDINIEEGSDKLESLSFSPEDVGPTSEGILFVVRPVIESGSTDADVQLFESVERNPIDQYLGISGLSTTDGVSTFQPGSGTGVQFENQEGERKFHLRVVENSGSDMKLQMRLRWVDLQVLP